VTSFEKPEATTPEDKAESDIVEMKVLR